jgi:hypothetical protein
MEEWESLTEDIGLMHDTSNLPLFTLQFQLVCHIQQITVIWNPDKVDYHNLLSQTQRK